MWKLFVILLRLKKWFLFYKFSSSGRKFAISFALSLFLFFPFSYHINKFKKTSQGFLCFPQLPHRHALMVTALDISLTSRKCQALDTGVPPIWGSSLFSSHFSSNSIEVKRFDSIELAPSLRTCCTGRHIHQGSKVFHSTINTCINEHCPDKQWSCLASSLRRRRRRWQGRK